MTTDLVGALTIVAVVAAALFAGVAAVFVRRLLRRPPTPVSEQHRAASVVLRKVRCRAALSPDEWDFAAQLIADRRNPAAYCLPAALFAVGCLYVFGSLYQLHGQPPSLRTWIGLLPMLGATNLALQMLRIARLASRLRDITINAHSQIAEEPFEPASFGNHTGEETIC